MCSFLSDTWDHSQDGATLSKVLKFFGVPGCVNSGYKLSLVTNPQRKFHFPFPQPQGPRQAVSLAFLGTGVGWLLVHSFIEGVPLCVPSFIWNFSSWAGPKLCPLIPLPPGQITSLLKYTWFHRCSQVKS